MPGRVKDKSFLAPLAHVQIKGLSDFIVADIVLLLSTLDFGGNLYHVWMDIYVVGYLI